MSERPNRIFLMTEYIDTKCKNVKFPQKMQNYFSEEAWQILTFIKNSLHVGVSYLF